MLFTIEEPEDGSPAKRDTDYRATFSDLTIPAGSKTGQATLTLTPSTTRGRNPPRSFIVVATVGTEKTTGTITIVDDETLTTRITLIGGS